MRRLILIPHLAVILSTLFVCSAQSQVDGLPEVKYDKQNKPRSIFINRKLADFTCVRSIRRNLKLIEIIYADGETQKIESLILADARNRREEYMLDLSFGDFVGVDEGWAKKMIGEGLVYNVGVIVCGAGGRGDPQIFSLEPTRPSRSARK